MKKKKFYYIYCSGLLGVKTDIQNFKWIYGSIAPKSTSEEYERCVVKFDICLKPEKNLSEQISNDKYFQSYKWNNSEKLISFRRTFFRKIRVGYNLKIDNNTAFVEVGNNYYRFFKKRVMNLHGMYYLLSDLANILLLKNGFATLYASAVNFVLPKKGIVFFAPPNTGKTLTATKLCELAECRFIGEDIVITDGTKLFSCPWTSSYRKKSVSSDTGGSWGRINNFRGWNICNRCYLTDMVILSLGKDDAITEKKRFLQKTKILNGYLFNYYSSPIIKLLGYFDEMYDKQWKNISENILETMVNHANCIEIVTESPIDFQEIVKREILGEN